jgi:hypothetical protein
MESWYFTPKVGIRSSIGEINFGDRPEDVENILGSPCYDMTQNVGDTGCWLRLQYDSQEKLVLIIFCMGSLIFEEMEMVVNTTKPQLKRYLKKKGFTAQKAYYLDGEYYTEICINVYSSKDVGGKSNDISGISMYYGEEYWERWKARNL